MINVQRGMLHKRTDEVSRLSMRFALILTSTWCSSEAILAGYLIFSRFIGLKRGMPWAPWSWTISDRLEHEVASLDKTSNKLSLKHEINQKHEDIIKSENTKM